MEEILGLEWNKNAPPGCRRHETYETQYSREQTPTTAPPCSGRSTSAGGDERKTWSEHLCVNLLMRRGTVSPRFASPRLRLVVRIWFLSGLILWHSRRIRWRIPNFTIVAPTSGSPRIT